MTSIVVNLKFHRAFFEKHQEEAAALLRAYFRGGGQQVQVNVCLLYTSYICAGCFRRYENLGFPCLGGGRPLQNRGIVYPAEKSRILWRSSEASGVWHGL